MPSTIRLGSTGADVAAWQRVLGIPDDGAFGPLTLERTKLWQRAHGLPDDGIVGPATWAAALGETAPQAAEWVRGIDVSVVQGKVPWKACREAGVRLAWMRGCVGNDPHVDMRFAENVRGAAEEGIVVGGYFFAYPLPHLDPVAQVEHACRLMTVDAHVVGERAGELPIALDLEWPPPEEREGGVLVDTWAKWKTSGPQILRWGAKAIVALHERTGCWPALYVYPYFWRRIIEKIDPSELAELCDVYGKCPLWMADYKASGRVPALHERPFTPAPWAGRTDAIVAWQHDGTGGLRLPNGIDVDWNVLVGGDEALARLTGQPREEPRELVVDLTAARQESRGIIVDALIAEYRRSRITNEAA